MSAGVPPHFLVLVVLALICLGSAAYAARAWPIRVRKALGDLRDRVDAAEENLESVQAKVGAKLVELTALIEEMEDLLAQVDKKRRRIAASESRERAQQEGAHDEDPYAQLRRVARAKGFPV